MFDNVTALLNNCPCGRKHSLLTEECVISADADAQMKDYITAHGFTSPAIICDENTHRFTAALSDITERVLTLGGGVHATEIQTALGDTFIGQNHPDVLIACGSGSIHDITRYCAHEAHIPFISYPTAASVDGFVSGVAAMTWHGQKLTFPSTPPIAVFASPDVFCTAPTRLTASGVGDVLGKYTSLFDWRVGEILTGEYRCPGICALEYDAIDAVCSALEDRTQENEQEYTIRVMEALLLSGLAMQLTGNSRPASAAEHHMSHLWEMERINKESSGLHGEQVGVGLLAVLPEYHSFIGHIDDSIDAIRSIDTAKVFDRAYLEPVFGDMTDGILSENLPGGKSSLEEIKLTPDTADRIREAAKALPNVEYAASLLRSAGAPTSTAEIGLPDSREFIKRSLSFAPYVRNRLSLLKVIDAISRTAEN